MIRLIPLLAAVALWWVGVSAEGTPLRVHFFDVGQGDAVLIQSPSGPIVLYDGGDSPSKIMAHLAAAGVDRIDLVVASHNHADHIGGLAEVIRHFRPRFYIDNGLPATTATYRRVLDAVKTAGTQLLEPDARQIRLGDEASLNVLPPAGVPEWGQNDNIVGVLVSFGKFRLSLGGDAEARQWAWWVQHHSGLLSRVQVHKASHHGSRNGDTADALLKLAPEVVIVSVGQNNGYGHPRPEALQLYAERGSSVFRTDLNGTVVVTAETSGHYTIRTDRGEGARPPPLAPPTRDSPPPRE